MLIPVNQNIDEYKDDFYKGLTLRQSVISLVTVAVGVAVYLALTMIFHLPQTLALYLTLPVVFPIAAYGFLKIHGMNIAEYVRKSGAVKEHSSYSFIPQMLMDGGAGSGETAAKTTAGISEAGGTTGKEKNKKAVILYLETEDSIRDLDNYEEITAIDLNDGKEEMQLT